MTRMQSCEWATPRDFFEKLNDEFHFTVDVCATKKNAKCSRFYSMKDNGLDKDWSNEIVWCNPPYDRTMNLWVKKAYQESQKGATVVCLLTSRGTDTQGFHEYALRANEIRFIKNRLYFVDDADGKSKRANLPNAVFVFRPVRKEKFPKICSIDTKGEFV